MLMCDHLLLYSDGGLALDRDNTGEGNEIIDIHVRDGRGTVLYFDTWELPLGTHSIESGGPFTSTAQVQPVMLVMTSRAGNGLPTETILTDLEPCDHLPTNISTPVTRPEVVGTGSTTTTPVAPSTTAPAVPTTSTTAPPTTEGTAPVTTTTVGEVTTSAPVAPVGPSGGNGSGAAPAAAARPVSGSARFTG